MKTDLKTRADMASMPRRAYQKPTLRRLGSFQEMTRTVETSPIVPTQDLSADTWYVS